MGIIKTISSIVLGTSEQRLVASILASHYWFLSADTDWKAGRDYYTAALAHAGIDPSSLAEQIDAALQVSYDVQFRQGVNAPEFRQSKREEKTHLEPGDQGFIREEALRTFQATGVYGLPTYRGHILTTEERKAHGLP